MNTFNPSSSSFAFRAARVLPLSFVAVAALSLMGCGGSTDTQEPMTGIGDGNGDGNGSSGDGPHLGSPDPQDPPSALNEPWMLIQPCPENPPSDPVEISEFSADGSRLTVRVSHGGGCESHSYGLCYANEWAESDPVQISLSLMHDAHDDGCDAYLTTDLVFDLGPLEEEYKRAYQTDGGSIRLSLAQQALVHSFGSGDLPSWEEIHASIDQLNTCEAVADCRSIEVEPCTSAYVNAGADISELQESIAARQELEFGGQSACDLSCACGVLSCEEGKCVAKASGCEDLPTPPETQMVCL